MMFGNLGWTELLTLSAIVVLFFGAKRLPEIGRAMGKGIGNLYRSMTSKESELDTRSQQRPPESAS